MTDKHPIGYCPHCGNHAPQRAVHTQPYMAYAYKMDGTKTEADMPSTYIVATCGTCDEILLYHDFGLYPEEQYPFTKCDLLWPNNGLLHRSVPAKIRAIYNEAYRIRNLAPNAFAVQIRRALEALADDRGANRGNLHRRLQQIAEKGEIPPMLAEMTDVLRLLGNLGAHASGQEVKPGHVSVLDEFFRAVIEYVYVAPSKIAEFREQLAATEAFSPPDD